MFCNGRLYFYSLVDKYSVVCFTFHSGACEVPNSYVMLRFILLFLKSNSPTYSPSLIAIDYKPFPAVSAIIVQYLYSYFLQIIFSLFQQH